MSCIELILYLEPSGRFKHNVQDFLNESKLRFGPNTANKYNCHVTMTGFFKVQNKSQQDEILKAVDQSIRKFKECPLPTLSLNSVPVYKKQEPSHLLLPVSVPEQYHGIMLEIAALCQPFVSLRLKKINHISLAYWDEPKATAEQQEGWNETVFQQIKDFSDNYFHQEHIEVPTHWDIVLYKRLCKGELLNEIHQFTEIGRWSVNK